MVGVEVSSVEVSTQLPPIVLEDIASDDEYIDDMTPVDQGSVPVDLEDVDDWDEPG